MSTVAPQAQLGWKGTWTGFKRLLPISIFVLIFGLAFGLAAIQTGLSHVDSVLMSALVFAGTSQFAALEMWGQEIPLLPLVITTFAINARHLLMGASLYPWLQALPWGRRYGIMLVISDANWAMAMQDYYQGRRDLGIILGGGLALWSTWVLGTYLGIHFGSLIEDPHSLGLDMVLGCFMLAMATGGPKNLRIFVIWLVAAGSALMAYWWLPANSHVVVGALVGGLIGAFWLEDDK